MAVESSTWGESEFARHATAPFAGSASSILANILSIKELESRRLIEFGGFYAMPLGDVKARRISDPDYLMELGQYMRIHPKPRRYPLCSTIDWEKEIMYENDWCVLVNKPALIPSHPTVDNLFDNVVSCIQAIRPDCKISAANRLDIPTSGFIVLCKKPSFMATFGLLQKEGMVSKRYSCLLRVRRKLTLQVGILTHYMMPSCRAPKIYRAEPWDDSWFKCQLKILRLSHVNLLPESIQLCDDENIQTVLLDALNSGDSFLDAEVELITGRTHQVRAQFSAEGCPLVGDTLYYDTIELNEDGRAPSAYLNSQTLALQSSSISFKMPESMGGDIVKGKLNGSWWSPYIEPQDYPLEGQVQCVSEGLES